VTTPKFSQLSDGVAKKMRLR